MGVAVSIETEICFGVAVVETAAAATDEAELLSLSWASTLMLDLPSPMVMRRVRIVERRSDFGAAMYALGI